MDSDLPAAGILLRGASTSTGLIVGRFDTVSSGGGLGQPAAVLPDFAAMQRPLRMKVTEPDRAARGGASATETLTLQDASGKQTFIAEREKLDSSYGAAPRDAN